MSIEEKIKELHDVLRSQADEMFQDRNRGPNVDLAVLPQIADLTSTLEGFESKPDGAAADFIDTTLS